uniref:WD_REPEATS_REGION domain-containing protein n=1 Tax=Panagrellus redivivus TaxID=6233 RepID=A0A7E4V610_PANRE
MDGDANLMELSEEQIAAMKPNKLSTKQVPLKSVVFNDIGDQFFTVTTDEAINIYQLEDEVLLTRINCKTDGIEMAIWGPHPEILICAPTKAFDIRYFSLHDNTVVRSFSGHTDVITSMMLCPDGNSLMTCSRDKTVKLWDMRQNQCTATIECSSVPVAAYDNEGLIMAIGVDDATIKLYDLGDLKSAFQVFDLHTYENVHFRGLKFSPGGNEIIITTNSIHTYLLDSFNAKHIHDLKEVADGPNFSSTGDFTNDEQFYLIGGYDGRISMFDAKVGKLKSKFDTPHGCPVTHVAFNPSFVNFVSGGSDGTLYTWSPV